MKTLTIQDIKKNGSKVISDEEVSYLIVNSKPKSVIMPFDQYEEMVEALEDYEDIRDAKLREDEATIDAEEVHKLLD